nr:putative reverse transcriptase domain-containing protein [Tanacetum cinerariifolium]
MPVELGSFDVIIDLEIFAKGLSCLLAHITKRRRKEKSKEKRLKDVLIVRDFPKVFPKYLAIVPSTRQVEFQIDLVPGAAPVARAPYRLAPLEIKESSDQLQELSDNAPILALAEGTKNFLVYCDAPHKELGAVVLRSKDLEKELNMRQRRWLELLSDYDCKIGYHPKKANLVADALSRKDRIKSLQVRALVMTIGLNLPVQILNAQTEAMKEENVKEENLCGINKKFVTYPNGTLCIEKRSWSPRFKGLRDLLMHKSHKSKYSIHPRFDKMYHDLKRLYLWPNLKAKIATYASNCLTCLKLKAKYQKLFGLLSLQQALSTHLDMSIAYLPHTDGQSERTIQTLEDMLRACVIDFSTGWDKHLSLVKFSYNNSYHTSIKAALFEELYGRKFRSPIC